MSVHSLLLGKILVAIGAGGGPIVFYGLPSSFTSEGQRQFKLSSEFKDLFSGSGGKKHHSETQNLSKLKSHIQGVGFWKIQNLGYWGWNSIYNLALKDDWKQRIDETGYKGVLSLVKTTYGKNKGEGEYKLITKEVTIDDKNKVWLIMAQGTKGIYLIPVVRNAERCGWIDKQKRKSDIEKSKKEVTAKGVEEIEKWTKEYDKREEWTEGQNEVLKGQMKDGFSIKRKMDSKDEIYQLGEWEQRMELWFKNRGVEGWKNVKESWVHEMRNKNQWTMYKNAGILEKGDSTESEQECNQIEHYFPLDLVILNKSEESTEPSIQKTNKCQTITMKDTISEVIGVRLDQVVISKTGIGDGSKRWLSWGTKGIQSPIFELLK